MTPVYLRFFADTSGSRTGQVALEYARSLVRMAPVRLVSVSGALEGGWRALDRLLVTPMAGQMIANVVCTEPELWVRRLKVPMPKHDPLAATLATGELPGVEPGVEVAERVMELYTEGVRNVLIAVAPAKNKDQAATAARYEMVIAPTTRTTIVADPRVTAVHVPVPVIDHAALRALVRGNF